MGANDTMNLVLFETEEESFHLAPSDPRAQHIQQVLKMEAGEMLFVGVLHGPRGKATVVESSLEAGVHLQVEWEERIPELFPVELILGIPRPQTARKILQECTSLGVSRLSFFGAEKGEPSYAQSKLWTTDEWQRYLWQGAEQAFTTVVPEVAHFKNLKSVFADSNYASKKSIQIALDVYEPTGGLAQIELSTAQPIRLALGAERGWSSAERKLLRDQGYQLVHLGDRVLRAETACLAAVSIVLSQSGHWNASEWE